MKIISLTENKIAFVDDEDFEWLNKFKWHILTGRGKIYAATGKSSKLMHRLILGDIPNGFEVDHIDGDGLNNQRSNLRIISHRANMQNLQNKNKMTSRFPGVSWNKRHLQWYSQIQINGERIFLGHFKIEEDAFHAYVKACELLEKGE